MPSSHLILCCPLLLLPSIFPSIRVFSNESALRIRWPKYWSCSFNISPSNEHPGLIPLGWTGWISLQSKGLSRVFSNTTVQKHQFFGSQLSLWSNPYLTTGKTIAWQNVVHWRREGQTITVFLPWENPMNSMKKQKDRTLKDELPRSVGTQYMLLEISGEITPERMKGWSQSKNNTQL